MRIDKNAEFIVNTCDVEAILQNLEGNVSPIKPLMLDNIVRRMLYKVVTSDEESRMKTRWLRIMDGDVECDGIAKCSVTFKTRRKDMREDEEAKLKVDYYGDATYLFDLLGFEQTSYQENKRTKFVCVHDGVKYIIRFDIWPKIEDITFIAIVATSSADEQSIFGLIGALDLAEYELRDDIRRAICEQDSILFKSKTDVDSVYRERFGHPASMISQVTFDFPLTLPSD